MKIALEYPVNEMSGAAAGRSGLVFFPWRNLQVARRYTIPANPKSSDQTVVRATITAAAKDYMNCTPAEVAGWASLANLYSQKIGGSTFVYPAISAFTKVNSYRQLNAQAITRTAPTAKPDFAVTGITSVTIVAGVMTINLTHSASAGAGRKIMVKLSAPTSSIVVPAPTTTYRLAKSANSTGNFPNVVAPSPQALTFNVVDLWRTFTVGEKIGVSLTPISADYTDGTPFVQMVQIA